VLRPLVTEKESVQEGDVSIFLIKNLDIIICTASYMKQCLVVISEN